MTARGRFAPSPTGRMHLGNAWAALLGWLAVRKAGGTMILRIEDLDPERSRPHYEAGLLEDLAWLGLDWDEGPDVGGPYGPYRQSERLGLYEEALAGLERRGLAYPCWCTRRELRASASAPHLGEDQPAYPGTCRDLSADALAARQAAARGRAPALRLRCPPQAQRFTDLLHGELCLAPSTGDAALRRSDGVHAYQLAVVVDDAAMGVNLVVRGDDLLPSTAGQAALFRMLGAEPPVFLHVPLLVDASGARLSKRHGSLHIAAIRDAGRQPQEVIGWLAALAGLLPRPRPVGPAELIPAFEASRLPANALTVEHPFGDVSSLR